MNKEERESREFVKLKELGLKLHVPIAETFLTLEVFDKEGNPVCPKCSSPVPKDKESCPNCGSEIIYHQRGHSWTRNAYNHLFCQLAGKNANDTGLFAAGKLSVKDTGGTIRAANAPLQFGNYDYSVDGTGYGFRATGSEDTWGILIGTGTNAESFEDYFLQTQIVEGTSAGQISHVASSVHSITYTAGTKVLKNDLVRYFNNNSGGSIGVNEICLVCHSLFSGVGPEIMHARDHLASTITVADTGQLQVVYTIQLTYPS